MQLGSVYSLPKRPVIHWWVLLPFAKGRQESQRGSVARPRPHSWEKPEVRYHARPIESPKYLISLSLKSVIWGTSLRS